CPNAAWSVSLIRTRDRAMTAGSVSHSRAEPSMSVKAKVTVPAGSAASRGSPGPVGDRSGTAAPSAAPRKLSLRTTARSSASSRSSALGVAKVRYDVVPAARMLSSNVVRRGSWSGAGRFRYKQHGLARGQAVLVFQAGDVHPRGDPAIPLPVDTHEHLALLQIGPVHGARRVRAGARLIPHRHPAQPLDSPPGGPPPPGQLFQGRGNKDPDPLVRREDNTGPDLRRLMTHRGPRTSALRVLILAPCPTGGTHRGTVRQHPPDVNRQAGPSCDLAANPAMA